MMEKLKQAAANADQWLLARGFKCEQKNGQRETLDKQLQTLPEDTRENEVFVGKIPRNLFEDELLPFMQQAGRVYKMRLMMDFGLTNRGYAFVRYSTDEEAVRAIKLLNNQRIRPNELPVGVTPSFDNRRLFFGNLPNLAEEELAKRLKEKINNIVSVKLHHKSSANNDKRYAFVEFETHTDATNARRLLLPGTIKICGRDITVDWAKADFNTNSNNHVIKHNNLNNSINTNKQIDSFMYTNLPSANAGKLQTNIFQENYKSFPGNLQTCLGFPTDQLYDSIIDSNDGCNYNILGHKAQELLYQATSNNNYQFNQKNTGVNYIPSISSRLQSGRIDYNFSLNPLEINTGYSNNYRAENILVIENINLDVAPMDRLKNLFELNKRLRILEIFKSGPSSLTIIYENASHADLMLETIVYIPTCFNRLTANNQILQARRLLA